MSAIIDEKIVASAKASNGVKEDPIVALTEHVDALYLFRDHYFQNHSIKDAKNKNDDVEREMKITLTKFDECKGYEIDGSRAKYYFLKGKALNVVERFIPQAEELLSKAVKLEPKLLDAWNELGECYWRKNDIKQAKNCFLGALTYGRNKVSLRNLSMILRQESTENYEQRVTNIKKGVNYAKEAVAFDTTDGQSWTILGNAYLALFFTVTQNPAILKLCMSAYAQAEKDIIAKSRPYLYFNKATALKYQEEYQLALDAFQLAMSLDPLWFDPHNKHDELLKYLKDVQHLITNKGCLKPRKLSQIVETLDKKHMGPYQNGSYACANKTIKLDIVSIKDLRQGINTEKVVFGKVACWIRNAEMVPFTFFIVDREKSCVAVTVYNLAEGRGVAVGDSISIPEPFYTHHQFSYKENEFNIPSIRVEIPTVLVVNGRKLKSNQQASAKLSSYMRCD